MELSSHASSSPCFLSFFFHRLAFSPSKYTFSISHILFSEILHHLLLVVQVSHAYRDMILPFMKLGVLALKTVCKPIANRLKKQAGLHPKFRQFIINVAQTNHRVTTTIQRRIYGHATDVEIRPLNEEKAVQAASDLIGELFVFSVAGVLVIFEVQRSARSEARKEALRMSELQEMKQRDDKLEMEIELLKHKVDELEQLARSRGLSGVFNFRQPWAKEDGQPAAAATAAATATSTS